MSTYETGEVIGQGGMGVVYRSRQTGLKREVAIKFMHARDAGDKEAVARFLREAELAAKIDSPNVVRIFDDGIDDAGRPFFVMEMLDGESLKDRLNRGPIPEAQVADIAIQVLTGLEAAHNLGIIHRDIKPSNIQLCADGRVKVLDFGIAKPIRGRDLTGAKYVMGTPEYMSPQQARHATPDVRSDLYSLGIVMYQMLAGELPFNAETPYSILEKHVHEPLPRLPVSAPKMEKILAKALAKDPADRFQSAHAMRTALVTAYPVHDTGRIPGPGAVDSEDGPTVPIPWPPSPVPDPPHPGPKPNLDPEPPSHPHRYFRLAAGIGLAALLVFFGAFGPFRKGSASRSDAPLPSAGGGVSSPAGEFSFTVPGRQIGDKFTNKDGSVMLWVPGGKFRFGPDKKEIPLDGFWIAENDVTVGQFKTYCKAAGLDFATFKVPAEDSGDDHPMVMANWYQARAYCKWAGGALPTEEQWEKAARGSDGQEYPWVGGFEPDRLWWSKSVDGGAKGTKAVGSKPAGKSPYGCYDMAGNVWQWTSSLYDASDERVLRGGSWYRVDPGDFRSANRYDDAPARQGSGSGFRLAGPP